MNSLDSGRASPPLVDRPKYNLDAVATGLAALPQWLTARDRVRTVGARLFGAAKGRN